LFITADEPVIFVTAGDQSHVRPSPNCFKNQKRLGHRTRINDDFAHPAITRELSTSHQRASGV
jgi:hypothetical protein